MADRNAQLPAFMADYNARFAKAPANSKDLHRRLGPGEDLEEAFAWKEERTLSRALTLQYDKILFILEPVEQAKAAIGKRVTVVDYPPAYVAFDLLWIDGVELRPKPLSERRVVLRGLLPEGSPTIAEALSVEGRGSDLYKLVCAHDLEGIVAKRVADPYGSRSRWLKIKNPDYSQAEGRGELFNQGRGQDVG